MATRIVPMRVQVPQAVLDDLRQRLERTRLAQSVSEMGWDYGTNTEYMKELVDYWLNRFDWRRQEERINQHPHFKAQVDDIGVHFMHIPAKGPNPMPLLMMHGYPWSWATLLRIVPLLTDPAAHGGRAEDAFTLIIPSLCGFCLSDQVPRR